jgi:tetratricopeptide (TPR) repeat protein
MKNALLFLLLWPSTVSMLRAETIRGLGTATFPTSTHVVKAQHEFVRGLLLLHVFEYPDAAKAFQAAQKLDPGFALAYWGEAMTFNHPVWNELDVSAGQAALAKFAATPEARAARIADPRERAFMASVEILYSGKGTKPERDAQYAKALEQMSKDYPSDDEVQLFYSLALLGKSEGVRDVPTYLQAAEIAKTAFMRNRDHPGAAHYWIHGMDDPQHAEGAQVAAKALSKIAPDAGHALHMCSHIFMALGMWDDVVEANENAMRVVDEHAHAAGRPPIGCGHYAIWLEYGYYQQGRIKDGDHVLAECKRTGEKAVALTRAQPGDSAAAAKKAEAMARQMNNSLNRQRGIALIESRDWNGSAATMKVDMADLSPTGKGYDAFATGYAAAEHGDRPMALSSLSNLRTFAAEAAKEPNADAVEVAHLGILVDELGGLISSKLGDTESAVTQVRHAAAAYAGMAFDFGPPETVKPPDELLGEILLSQRKAAEARTAFETSLKSAPRRAESLLGLARAQSALGDGVGAADSYGELLEIWKDADPGYAPLAEAERHVTGGAAR